MKIKFLTPCDIYSRKKRSLEELNEIFKQTYSYFTERGLAEYIWASDGDRLDERIKSISLSIETDPNDASRHVLAALADSVDDLTDEDIYALEDYLEGQWSDGYGENLPYEKYDGVVFALHGFVRSHEEVTA